ncbi:hypothetical protein GQ55_4G068900 [Panicum hallii var. hallii]|uniref:Uncharacterized protein n=1 Tax=Panicum hallii var. hallii TaxID=1504633 RepID=A0A2T7DW14_9POAL|nr:hypothetical protein GQ55_4G068900 [Panicum hallii var. hallii]
MRPPRTPPAGGGRFYSGRTTMATRKPRPPPPPSLSLQSTIRPRLPCVLRLTFTEPPLRPSPTDAAGPRGSRGIPSSLPRR